MEFLHTMVRVSDVDASLRFYCDGLGLKEISRFDSEPGRFTLIYLATPEDIARAGYSGGPLPAGLPCVELTHNWDPETYEGGRNFGHLAYRVADLISVQLLQKGKSLPPQEPWASMENTGSW